MDMHDVLMQQDVSICTCFCMSVSLFSGTVYAFYAFYAWPTVGLFSRVPSFRSFVIAAPICTRTRENEGPTSVAQYQMLIGQSNCNSELIAASTLSMVTVTVTVTVTVKVTVSVTVAEEICFGSQRGRSKAGPPPRLTESGCQRCFHSCSSKRTSLHNTQVPK
jgi:hypothetical protein